MKKQERQTESVSSAQTYSHLIPSFANAGWIESLSTHDVTLPAGHMLCSSGEMPDNCYYIRKGQVIDCAYTKTGQKNIYNVFGPGSLLFDISAILNRPVESYFETKTPCTFAVIPCGAMLRAFQSRPEIAMDMYRSLAYLFLCLKNQVRSVSRRSIEWRICNLLLSMAATCGDENAAQTQLTKKITQQECADLLATSRVTVARVFRKLRERNLLELEDGQYRIRVHEIMQFMEELQ